MFHPYVPAVAPCSGKAQAGTKNLAVAIVTLFSHAMDFGIYNCRPVVGGSSWSIHSDGRAFDAGFPVVSGKAHPQGYSLLRVLSQKADELGIMGIIWDRKRYDRGDPFGQPYEGPGLNPHIDHLHIEMVPTIAETLTLDQAFNEMEEAMFTDEEIDVLKDFVAALKSVGSNGDAGAAMVKLVRLVRQLDDLFDQNEI